MNATTEIDPKLVKQLREKTNAGFMDCKRALVESGGDLEKAETILRTKGIATAAKKATRATKEGIVASYIHLQGKVGVLVEVNCETDFVARNENFREFVKDITLHIAAAHPLYVSRADVPGNLIEAEREIYKAQVQGKPAQVAERRQMMVPRKKFFASAPVVKGRWRDSQRSQVHVALTAVMDLVVDDIEDKVVQHVRVLTEGRERFYHLLKCPGPNLFIGDIVGYALGLIY